MLHCVSCALLHAVPAYWPTVQLLQLLHTVSLDRVQAWLANRSGLHGLMQGWQGVLPVVLLKNPMPHALHTRSLVLVGDVMGSNPTPHVVVGTQTGLLLEAGLHAPIRNCSDVQSLGTRQASQTVSAVPIQETLT